MNTTTLEKFESGRMSKLIDGILIVGTSIKNWYKKYKQYRQNVADKRLAFYIKDHGDVERFQRDLHYIKAIYLIK